MKNASKREAVRALLMSTAQASVVSGQHNHNNALPQRVRTDVTMRDKRDCLKRNEQLVLATLTPNLSKMRPFGPASALFLTCRLIAAAPVAEPSCEFASVTAHRLTNTHDHTHDSLPNPRCVEHRPCNKPPL
jgi:hypothetical protein